MTFRRLSKTKKAINHINDDFADSVLNTFIDNAPAKQKANKKIKSAVKEFKYGITFDSRLELYMYELLLEANIRFKFKPTYILQEGFRYRGEWVHPITLTTDFELEDYDIIIDPKGFANDTAPLKNKMLKQYLFSKGRQPRIIFPSSQVKCREIIYRIKNGFYLDPQDPKQRLSDNQIKVRIKELRKHLEFDGIQFTDIFAQERDPILLEHIKIMERWDFELLLANLSGKAF